MASLKSFFTGEPISEPESLELDYDMWQGQFDFIGPTHNNSTPVMMNGGRQKTPVSSDDSNLNLVFDRLEPSKAPILIDEETFLSLHPGDLHNDPEGGPDGPHSGLFFDSPPSLNVGSGGGGSRKNKRIDNFFNANLQKQKILFMNDKNVSDSLEREKPESEGDDEEIKEPGYDMNNNNSDTTKSSNGNLKGKISSSPSSLDNRLIMRDTLNDQVEILQRQVSTLAATQTNADDQTTRTKTENAVLQARYYMLEEQLRECELRADQRLLEEQKNHRELLARVEREAQLQAENFEIKLKANEKELSLVREEMQRLRVLYDKQASDLHLTQEKLEVAQEQCQSLQQENDELRVVEKKLLADKKAQEELMLEMDREIERVRSERGPAMPTTSPEALRLEELHHEMDELRQANKHLTEANEELQALVLTRGVEEGINLLNGTSNSLAQELHDMSQTQDSVDSTVMSSLTQLQSAFKDKEDENQRLKTYIDTILLNIVENYPQLLEVKGNGSSAIAMSFSK